MGKTKGIRRLFSSNGITDGDRSGGRTTGLRNGLHLLVFVCFFILSLRTLFVYLNCLSDPFRTAGFVAVGIGYAVCWYRPKGILWLFIACIPLVGGIQGLGVMKVAPLLSFGFSLIYITWFSKRIFLQETDFRPGTGLGLIVDMLAACVLISLLTSLSAFPLSFSLHRLAMASNLGQNDPFWFMEAGYIMLQGLFLFRMIEFEAGMGRGWGGSLSVSVLYCHALIILIFSVVQLTASIPDHHQARYGLCSPFQDIHAYSGYVLILFFFFLNRVFKGHAYRVIDLALTVVLFGCVLLAGSMSALIWLLIVSFIFFFFRTRKVGIVCGALALTATFVIAANMISLSEPTCDRGAMNRYLNRLKYSSAMDHLKGRFMSWDQAVGIMSEFPLTGSGAGSFYQVSHHYRFFGDAHPERVENAHNYYLQYGSELGIPALVLFIVFFADLFIKRIKRGLDDPAAGLFFGSAAYLLCLLTEHHLLLSNHQFLFWFVIALTAFPVNMEKGEDEPSMTIPKKLMITSLMLLLVAGHINRIFFTGNEVKGTGEFGYYRYERIDSDRMRWTMEQTSVEVTATSDYVGLSIYGIPDYFDKKSIGLDIIINGSFVERLNWDKEEVKHRYYYIPGLQGHRFKLETVADGSYNPFKKGLPGGILTSRRQSVAVTDPEFFQIPISREKAGCVFLKLDY